MENGEKPAKKNTVGIVLKAVLLVNVAADAFMSIFSAVQSYNWAVSIGMIILGVCFIIAFAGIFFIGFDIKKSSYMLIDAAYLLINILLGGVFAGEFFGAFSKDFLGAAETGAAIIIAVVIVLTVNVLVKRKIDGKL